MTKGSYRLIGVSTDAEWRAYHVMRRRVLFELRGMIDVYREDHPDEHADGNHPLLLTLDGEPVGTTRVDFLPHGIAVMRMVAISEHLQGQGHGRILLQQAEAFAHTSGARRCVVNAAPDAIGFYARSGYRWQSWTDPAGAAKNAVQMVKDLA